MELWLRDEKLVRRGMFRALGMTVVLNRSGVGTWTLDASAEQPAVSRVRDGWGVIAVEDGQVVFSGPIEKRVIEQDSTRTVTWSGKTDMVVLEDRVTYPDPTNAAGSQTKGYYTDSGPAGEVISRLVDRNCGPGALTARRTRGFARPGLIGGNRVSVNTRLKPVVDEVQKLAAAGGLVVDLKQSGNELVLVSRPARDLSRAVRLTAHTGEVSSATMSQSAPTATVVVVGGQGEGASRQLKEQAATSPGWGGRRIEVFQDRRDTDDPAELVKAAGETLEKAAASATASSTVTDTPRRRFGVHYNVGDIVTVSFGDGAQVSETVESATLTWTETTRTVKLTVGAHESEDDRAPAWVSRVKALDARMRRVETQ